MNGGIYMIQIYEQEKYVWLACADGWRRYAGHTATVDDMRVSIVIAPTDSLAVYDLAFSDLSSGASILKLKLNIIDVAFSKTKEQAWGTGGYHEVILRDGSVQRIYNDNVTTNGVGNHNSKTYHICVVGNGSLTAEQEAAFDARARATMDRFGLKVDDVLGHNEFSGYTSNSCPGINMTTVRNRLKGSSNNNSSTSTFNINNYHTTKFNQIRLVKADWAYKEVSLKNRVGDIVPKGTVLTVTGLEYSGQYPRFKLKSGLYITTRKDTVEEYKASSSNNTAVATPPANVWHSRSGTVTVTALLALICVVHLVGIRLHRPI